VDLTFNSDLPGSDHDIFYGLHAAVTRRDKQAKPSKGWQAQEVVTMEEALRAYTGWAAYAAFREQQTGVLKKGAWADITVIDIDPFELASTNPEALLKGKILMTVVGGEVVHDAASVGD
jgi:predicted amidohydrolase YtcJ